MCVVSAEALRPHLACLPKPSGEGVFEGEVSAFRGDWGQRTISSHRCVCMGYRYETATIEGFVQQLAVSYVAHGYWFYVTGIIPEGKDPRRVDRKLIEKYEIDV